jgi:hypothetical protein
MAVFHMHVKLYFIFLFSEGGTFIVYVASCPIQGVTSYYYYVVALPTSIVIKFILMITNVNQH